MFGILQSKVRKSLRAKWQNTGFGEFVPRFFPPLIRAIFRYAWDKSGLNLSYFRHGIGEKDEDDLPAGYAKQ